LGIASGELELIDSSRYEGDMIDSPPRMTIRSAARRIRHAEAAVINTTVGA